MRAYRQDDEVKVAVYCADMPAEQQSTQDFVLALLMTLSALAVVGLRYIF